MKYTLPLILGILSLGVCNAEDANNPKPNVTIKIIDQYPTNNKILAGGTGNTTVLTSKVTPNDTGTYTWSYPEDLRFKPNGTTTARTPTISTRPAPFPATKDSVKVKVVFVSNTGKGTASDERPLNVVAPEHFAAQASSQPTPTVTTIQLDQINANYAVINIRSDYFIQDGFREQLGSSTAFFCGGQVQTKELVPWATTIGLPSPQVQAAYLGNNSGVQTDQIEVNMKGTMIVKNGAFNRDLVGTDIGASVPHVWKARAQNTSAEYSVTNNELHIVLTSISPDGQVATVTATYTVRAQ